MVPQLAMARVIDEMEFRLRSRGSIIFRAVAVFARACARGKLADGGLGFLGGVGGSCAAVGKLEILNISCSESCGREEHTSVRRLVFPLPLGPTRMKLGTSFDTAFLYRYQ